jgi:hypothetical protein
MTNKYQAAKHRTIWKIFAIPLLIGVLSAVGLVSALVGDGVWDDLSWVLLLIPIIIGAACILLPRE